VLALTRRRDRQSREEAWLIYYSDVHVGTIDLRSGNPATSGSMGLVVWILSGLGTERLDLRHSRELLGSAQVL
jgi:hypothetical protein